MIYDGIPGQTPLVNKAASFCTSIPHRKKKILTMPTDPARIKRTDPGEPEKCPVWQFHKIYSNTEVRV